MIDLQFSHKHKLTLSLSHSRSLALSCSLALPRALLLSLALSRSLDLLHLMKLPSNRAGLMKLRQEITACEYKDVRVMWELIRRKEEDGVVGRYSKLTFWPSRPTDSGAANEGSKETRKKSESA